jgi:hypothetical protein
MSRLQNAIAAGRQHGVPEALLEEGQASLKQLRDTVTGLKKLAKRPRGKVRSAGSEKSIPVSVPRTPETTDDDARESADGNDSPGQRTLKRSSSLPTDAPEGFRSRDPSPAEKQERKQETTGRKQIAIDVRAGAQASSPPSRISMKTGYAAPPPTPASSPPDTPPSTAPPTPLKATPQRRTPAQTTPTPRAVGPDASRKQREATAKKPNGSLPQGRSADRPHAIPVRAAASRAPAAQKVGGKATGAVAPVAGGVAPPSAPPVGQKAAAVAPSQPRPARNWAEVRPHPFSSLRIDQHFALHCMLIIPIDEPRAGCLYSEPMNSVNV